jgi:hypothetical protein
MMFDAARELPGAKDFFKAPTLEIQYIGLTFIAGHDPPILRQKVCAALCARERFRRDAPAWAPSLPLRWEDCEELENDSSPRLNLVGYYGSSLRWTDWDRQHPPFATFASRLLAYKHAPDNVRNDNDIYEQMRVIASQLTPEEMKAVAAFYGAQDRQLASKD